MKSCDPMPSPLTEASHQKQPAEDFSKVCSCTFQLGMMFPHCLKARVTVVCLEFQVTQVCMVLQQNRSREALQPCLFASSNMVLITLKNRWNIALLKPSKSSSQDTSYPITKLQTLDFKPEFSVTLWSFAGPEAYPKQNPKHLPTNVYSLQCVHLLTCSLSAFVAVQAERRWVEISSGKIISTCMWSSSEGPPTVIWARAKLRKFQDCRRKYDFFHAAEVVLVWSEH